tara:strand:- start:254 stop:706 length:453 start_codon:yes stop_codon:yes gene_type:complete
MKYTILKVEELDKEVVLENPEGTIILSLKEIVISDSTQVSWDHARKSLDGSQVLISFIKSLKRLVVVSHSIQTVRRELSSWDPIKLAELYAKGELNSETDHIYQEVFTPLTWLEYLKAPVYSAQEVANILKTSAWCLPLPYQLSVDKQGE